jgi:hypothetical protein
MLNINLKRRIRVSCGSAGDILSLINEKPIQFREPHCCRNLTSSLLPPLGILISFSQHQPD